MNVTLWLKWLDDLFRWFRLYTASDKGVLHFRILHTSAETTYMEIRFNQRRWNENKGAEEWVGPWINPMPTLITGTNVVEIMMEVETFQVSFNGLHIDLERSMPVYVNELAEVRYIFMQLKDDHVAFLDGTKILTPHAVPNPGQYTSGTIFVLKLLSWKSHVTFGNLISSFIIISCYFQSIGSYFILRNFRSCFSCFISDVFTMIHRVVSTVYSGKGLIF